ncbi:hypothetical protein [Virgibacillus sp. YIM 98842]|uniref:Gp37-like protein n=1 Tax=Virgibacillus sp. YIM 98842 TaxID=2663533 RepID=UPI0013DBAA61|nr:hypothetical protein [Virgibacillus sp. YIM 98842]
MKPIRVYDKQLNMLTETDNYLSLQFNPRFYEVGEFELHINQYIEGAEYFVKGNLVILDKRGDKAMLIRHREIALDQNGKVTENWRVTGVTLKGVLDQRVTIPPEGQSHDKINDAAETVMKHYVHRHFVNPVDPSRKIDYIEIAPDKGRGSLIEWESRFKNVADELTAISKQANLGWIMYADMERGKWIFDVVEPRNVTQGNEAGLQPVFFSPDFSTIKTQQFVDSDNNYRNVGYVGGQGEGVERKIVKIGEAEGMGLHEVFIDARDVSETDEETEEELPPEEYEALLIERGEQRMREFETTFYLEAQILTPSINRNNDFAMSTPFEYEKDFRLGDLVEVFNKKWNITMNAPITEFTEIHEPSGFILEATFGEAQPTLITKIRDKFNELDGIEKQELPARLAVERMRDAMQYGDERLSEEEQARIEQALEILDESKEWASGEAYQAEQDAKKHADEQDIVYDEEAKLDASEKSEQARDDAQGYAEAQDDIVRDDAALDATDKADQAEDNAIGHADQRADEAEQNAKDYTDENAVDRGTYEIKMQEIADDLADRTTIEYVNGQLVDKANIDDVYTIEDINNRLLNYVGITEYETDIDGIVQTLDDQNTQISQNEEAIGLKASQEDLNTVEGRLSTAEGELSVLPGQIALKADSEYLDDVEERVTTVELNIDGLEGAITSKVEEDEVRSIFTQEAGSFTFDANQINFEGHVFGEDATFAGLVSGGAIEQNGDTGSIILDDEGFKVYNKNDEMRISMLITDSGGFQGEENALIFWNTINHSDGSSEIVPMLSISQYYTGAQIKSDELTLVADILPLTIDGSGVVDSGFARYGVYIYGGIYLNSNDGTGNQNGIQFGQNNHYVSDFQNALVFYPNRGPHGDQDPVIRFRTHSHTNNYRDDLYISGDGTLFSNPTQDNTSSNSSNLRIAMANNGDYRFYRTTSARKYKTEIQPIDADPYSLLDINPKAWYDKREVEENNGLTHGLKKHHGIIANDLEQVGLYYYVDYQDGEIENYDERVWTLLIPITRDHEEKITDLYSLTETHEEKIKRLETEIEKLKGVA